MKGTSVVRLCIVLATFALVACGGGGGGDSEPSGPASVIASLTASSAKYRGVPISLNASQSRSPSGHTVQFEWSLLEQPNSSAANIVGTGAIVTLTPDVVGTYQVALRVTAGDAADTRTMTLDVEQNEPPQVSVNADKASAIGPEQHVFDASDTFDPEGQPLTFAWSITAMPTGASPSATTGADEEFIFTTSESGHYEVTLTVDDGVNDPVTVVSGSAHYTLVDEYSFIALAADHHYDTGVIVAVSADPSAFHFIDAATGTTTEVALPAPPLSVAISPAGDEAVVGHGAWVSIIDMATKTITVTWPVDMNAEAVAHGGNGYVYLLGGDQWVRLRAVAIADGTITQHTGNFMRAGSRLRMHPFQPWLYAADRGLSPSDIEKVDVSGNPPDYVSDSPYHGDYGMCGDLWLTRDGSRIITACGNTFRSTSSTATDMTFAGALSGESSSQRIATATDSPDLGEIAVIRDNGFFDEVRTVELYESEFLNTRYIERLPDFRSPENPEGNFYPLMPVTLVYGAGGSERLYMLLRLEDGPDRSVLLRR